MAPQPRVRVTVELIAAHWFAFLEPNEPARRIGWGPRRYGPFQAEEEAQAKREQLEAAVEAHGLVLGSAEHVPAPTQPVYAHAVVLCHPLEPRHPQPPRLLELEVAELNPH